MPSIIVFGSGSVTAHDGAVAQGSGIVSAPGGVARPYESFGDGSVDASGIEAMHGASGSGKQEAGLIVYVGGLPVPMSNLLSVEVDRSIDRPRQTWMFAVIWKSPTGFFGNPLSLLAPSLGNQRVDIFGVYRVSDGSTRKYPLISNGLVSESVCSIGPDGWRETFNGFDSSYRVGRVPVTLIVPAGSGMTRAQLVQKIFTAAGETMFMLGASGVVNKEVQLVDADPVSVAQDMLGTENRYPSWDVNGFLRDVQVAPYSGEILEFELLERDILRDTEADLTTPGDVITSITLTSTKQVTKSPNQACARKVTTTEQVTYSLYGPKTSLKIQNSACALNASGESPAVERYIPVQRVVSTTEEVCGTLVVESTMTYSYRRQEAARYQWSAADHAFVCISGVFLDADATPSGQETAYVDRRERWLLTSSIVTHHYYDKINFTGPDGETSDPWFGHFRGTGINTDNPGTGYKLGSITDSMAYYYRQAALKAQTSPAVAWETIEPAPGVLVTGAGYGVSGDREEFMRIERQVNILKSQGPGYLASSTNYIYRWGIRPGSAYWYRGDVSSGDPSEIFVLANHQSTSYVPAGEASHRVYFVNFDDLQGGVVGSTISTATGAPPAIERMQDEGDEAPVTETQTIKSQVTAPGLLAEHEPREVKTSVSWAESEDELSTLGELKILESVASTVELECRGAYFPIRDGCWGRLRVRPWNYDGPALVKGVRHWRDEPSPFVTHTSLTLLIMPST